MKETYHMSYGYENMQYISYNDRKFEWTWFLNPLFQLVTCLAYVIYTFQQGLGLDDLLFELPPCTYTILHKVKIIGNIY
jgi:hypothetical protein